MKDLDFVPNIFSRDVHDRTVTVKNMVTTVSKLSSGDIFGMDKYLSSGVDIQERTVTNSGKRVQLNQEMQSYFRSLGIRNSRISSCELVAEELLMNAIYDAPTDANGNAIYNHLPRTQAVALDIHQQAKFRFGTDGTLFAVSVEDPFGSLKGEIITKYLESCYGGRAGEINLREGKGGAGRGLHMIIENSDFVVFNISPKQKTEVICIFNVDQRNSEGKYPNFHFFEQLK